jgi:cell division protein FtsZ
MDDTILKFNYSTEPNTDSPSIIKVIGVGGGGGNAVTHMYREGIHDVKFVLANTDNQALFESDVPVKIPLGRQITQGLGAGNKPERARMAAEESLDELRTVLSDGTKMAFITAGMGGGTGTGAAPVIARVAKDLGILTVGIVTIPFVFEGDRKIMQALTGVEEIAKNVDALLVINNERLREIYPDLTILNAFGKADDTLTVAAKSIAEIITVRGLINLDFADVNSTMKDGGVAIMSTGFGDGDDRVGKAIKDALTSPLLNNNDISSAKKILLNVSFSKQKELLMEEMNHIHEFMKQFGRDIEVIWGTAIDESLGTNVKLTILATGFGVDTIPDLYDARAVDSSRMSEEEFRRLEDKRIKEQAESDLRRRYYGEDVSSKRIPTRSKSVVLSIDELDDDALISLMEETPTYNRDPKVISHMRNPEAKLESSHVKPATPANKEVTKENTSTIISFR